MLNKWLECIISSFVHLFEQFWFHSIMAGSKELAVCYHHGREVTYDVCALVFR